MAKQTKPSPVTKGEVGEMISHELRKALREQAREMEKHLNNINERLTALEQRSLL